MNAAKRNLGLTMLISGLLTTTNLLNAGTMATRQIPEGEKTKVTGAIASRNGDLITVRDKKTGDLVDIAIFEDTKIERRKGKFLFARHPRMDVTALLPGLTIEAEGTGNSAGKLDAKKIVFSPDEFAISIATQQQIIAAQIALHNTQSTAEKAAVAAQTAQALAEHAQSSADQAQSSADAAQSASDDAQLSADGALKAAKTATEIGIIDADAIRLVNSRVSELDDYRIVNEGMIYFADGQAVLDDSAKEELRRIAGIASTTDNYMIEIAGYASTTGSKQLNQTLSEARAAAVADYLRQNGNVPMRRILAPAGYGKARAVASATDRRNQELDRRVDVRILVNEGLSPSN